MTQMETRPTVQRLYRIAVTRAKDAAGGERAFAIIGATFRQALVGRELLTVLAQQDEAVSADRVRQMLTDLYHTLSSDESLV